MEEFEKIHQKNIEFWENEVQEALKENDIWKAIGCRILANKLREDLRKEFFKNAGKYEAYSYFRGKIQDIEEE